jgi:hypothetical protein
MGKQFVRCSSFCHRCFLWRDILFLQLSLISLFGANRAYFHIETPWLQKVSFPKLAQLSQENNVLHASASNTDCFLLRNACVSSNYPNRAIGNEMSLFDLEKRDLQEVLISKTNSTHKGKQCARCYSY